MIVVKIKSTTAAATANDALMNWFKEYCNTEPEKNQVYTLSELLQIRDEAEVIHSAIFDLESAYKTVAPLDPHTADEIDSIIRRMKRELKIKEDILERCQFE